MPEPGLVLAEEPIIAGCMDQMRHLQQQIWLLHRYAERQVACQDGFRGIFDVLRPALGQLAGASELMALRFSAGYGEVIDTLGAADRSLRACDELVDAEFARLMHWLDRS